MAKAKLEIHGKDKTKRAFDSVNGRLDKTKRAGKALAGVLGGALAAGGLALFIRKSLLANDALAKMSDRLGVTTENLAAFHHLGKLSGLSVEEVDKGLEKMTKTLGEAAAGLGLARDYLKGMQLDAATLAAMKPEEAYAKIADKINVMGTQADKTAAIMSIFGRAGGKMLKMMEGGAASFEEARIAVERYGTAISRVDAKAIEDANDAMERVSEAARGLGTQIAIRLAPVIEKLSKGVEFLVVKLTDLFRMAPVEDRIASIKKEIAEMHAIIEKTADEPISDILGDESDYDYASERLDELTAKLKTLQLAKATPVGGPAGEDPNAIIEEKQKASLQRQVDALANSLLSEEERMMESFARKEQMIADAEERKLISKTKYDELLLQLEAKKEDQMTALFRKGLLSREKLQQLSGKAQTKVMLGYLMDQTKGLASSNKTMFEINKAASLGMAIVNIATGITKALSIQNYAGAAFTALKGAATISTIQGASYGGGGGAPSIGAGGAETSVGAESLPDVIAPGTAAGGEQRIIISVDGDMLSTNTLRGIVEEINNQRRDNVILEVA